MVAGARDFPHLQARRCNEVPADADFFRRGLESQKRIGTAGAVALEQSLDRRGSLAGANFGLGCAWSGV